MVTISMPCRVLIVREEERLVATCKSKTIEDEMNMLPIPKRSSWENHKGAIKASASTPRVETNI